MAFIRKSSKKNFYLRWAITCILIVFLYQKIDLVQLASAFSAVNFFYLGGGFLLTCATIGVDSYRLKMSLSVFHPEEAIQWRHILKIYYISLFFSIVLPGGQLMNESVKAYKLFAHCPKKIALVSVGVDKFIGLIALLGVTIIFLFFDSSLPYTSLRYIFTAFLILAVGFLLSIIHHDISRWLKGLSQKSKCAEYRFFGRYFSLGRSLLHLSDVLAITEKMRNTYPKLALIVLLASSSQILGAFSTYFLAKSAHISLDPMTVGWIFGAFGIIGLLPVTVSGIGIREVSYTFFFQAYGIDVNPTIVFCLAQYLIILLNIMVGIVIYACEYMYMLFPKKSHDTEIPSFRK